MNLTFNKDLNNLYNEKQYNFKLKNNNFFQKINLMLIIKNKYYNKWIKWNK